MCRNSLINCQIFKNSSSLIVKALSCWWSAADWTTVTRWRGVGADLVDPAGGVMEVWSDRSSGRFHGHTQDFTSWFLWRLSCFALGLSWQAQRRSWVAVEATGSVWSFLLPFVPSVCVSVVAVCLCCSRRLYRRWCADFLLLPVAMTMFWTLFFVEGAAGFLHGSPCVRLVFLYSRL